MNRANRRFLTWRIAAASVVPVTLVCAVFSAFVLDAFLLRPTVDGGSVNTLLPGSTYAMATIMKVCLIEGFILTGVAAFSYLMSRREPLDVQLSLPLWTITSLMLPPLAMVAGTVAIMVAQSLSNAPDKAGSFTYFSRSGVIVMMACLIIAIVASIYALVRKEVSVTISLISLAAAVVLVGLFLHLEFYAIGFHQDNWAPTN